MAQNFEKHLSEIETFAIDWANYLSDANDGSADTIATATWTVDTGITKDADSIVSNKTLIRLSGGTVGEFYNCQCQLTLTNGSDTPIRHIVVRVAADPV